MIIKTHLNIRAAAVVICIVFLATFARAALSADVDLFHELFEQCRADIEDGLPFDTSELDVFKRGSAANDGTITGGCSSIAYTTEDVYVVAIVECESDEWERPRRFCSISIPPEFREADLFDASVWIDKLISKYETLSENGTHNIEYENATHTVDFERGNLARLDSNIASISMTLNGANMNGCAVHNFIKINKDGSDLRGVSSEPLHGNCYQEAAD